MRLRATVVLGLALVVAGCDASAERVTGPGEAPAARSTSSTLAVSVSGPTDIYSAGTYEWTAVSSGGCDPANHTYTWYYNGTYLMSGPTMRWYIDSTWQSRGFTVVVQEAGHGSSANAIYIANHLAANDT